MSFLLLPNKLSLFSFITVSLLWVFNCPGYTSYVLMNNELFSIALIINGLNTDTWNREGTRNYWTAPLLQILFIFRNVERNVLVWFLVLHCSTRLLVKCFSIYLFVSLSIHLSYMHKKYHYTPELGMYLSTYT